MCSGHLLNLSLTFMGFEAQLSFSVPQMQQALLLALPALDWLILLPRQISLWSLRSRFKRHHYYLDQRDLPPQCISIPLSSRISVTVQNLFTCLLCLPPPLDICLRARTLWFVAHHWIFQSLHRRCAGNVCLINE